MQVQETFEVAAPLEAVWAFFEQVERVAHCVPGVKRVEVRGPGRYAIVAGQKVGFISATFEMTTEVARTEPGRFMEFASVGKSIAGAVGHLRSRDRVDFEPAAGGTRVRLTSELAVGGMLGALGHKAIAAKSREITEQFAAALRAALVEEAMPVQTAVAADVEILEQLNRDYIRSVQNSDVRRFDEILAEDFVCSNPDGSLVDRSAFLAQTARPVTISNLEAHDVRIRIMGDVAIIHARTAYTRPDGAPGAGRYTDVWARRQGRWLAVSAHVTRA